MQKKLIALAVAGLVSAPVFAQSNVTIYGVADAAIGFGHSDDNDFRGVVGGVLSGNRIGFKGSEDLGNGLKAVFTLEQGFNIDDGTAASTRQFHRQSFVGLQGAFGTVALGRQYAPGYFANYDAALGASISPQSTLTSDATVGLTITPNSPARWDNSIAYTGTFGGLTARATYSAQTEDEATVGENESNDDRWGASLDYANGPFKAGVVYHYVKQTTSDAQKEWYVGAEYNFGMASLTGSYQAGKDVTTAAGIAAGEVDRDLRVWNLGVIVPVSAAGKVHVSYGKLQERDFDDADAKNWVVAYTHSLSKRTTAYAAYNRTHNDDGRSIGALNGTLKSAAGENPGMAVVGMRHTF